MMPVQIGAQAHNFSDPTGLLSSQLFHAGVVARTQTGGVAYLAHVGGFILGAVTARWFEGRQPIA
jgi:membrane associated rhomboid family serine protease